MCNSCALYATLSSCVWAKTVVSAGRKTDAQNLFRVGTVLITSVTFTSTLMNNRQRQRTRVDQQSLCMANTRHQGKFWEKIVNEEFTDETLDLMSRMDPSNILWAAMQLCLLLQPNLSCPQEPLPTKKKKKSVSTALLRCVFILKRVIPHHESIKSFKWCLRGFSNLSFLVRYLGCTHSSGSWKPSECLFWGAQLSDSLLSLAVMPLSASLYSQVEKLAVSCCRWKHCVKMLKFCPSRLWARGNVGWIRHDWRLLCHCWLCRQICGHNTWSARAIRLNILQTACCRFEKENK